jgi:DNA (cytosine-5)-methyltransferase 1
MLDLPKKLKKLKNLNYIDLFAGIGGFRLALDSFGAKCVFTSEWDKYAQQVYTNNFGTNPHGDITKVNELDIPNHDLLCGGFPCQAFSVSGKQKGFDDTRGTLFFDIARILKYHNPKFVILENVKNIIKHNNGQTLSTILKTLDDLNYDVFYELLRGSNFGVPQHRERVFFICFRKDLKVNEFTLSKPNLNMKSINDILEENINDEEIIINRKDIVLNTSKIDKDLLGNFPTKPIRIGTINKGGQGERIYSINGTGITLSAYGGGPANKTGAYLVDGKIRKLTIRECARMMGFPENFKICDNKRQAYTQFGNAVIVNIVQFIISDLIDKKILDT